MVHPREPAGKPGRGRPVILAIAAAGAVITGALIVYGCCCAAAQADQAIEAASSDLDQ